MGVITGHLITFWIAFNGFSVEKPPAQIPPLHVDGCTNTSFNPHILKPEHRGLEAWNIPTTTSYPFDFNDTEDPYDLINTDLITS